MFLYFLITHHSFRLIFLLLKFRLLFFVLFLIRVSLHDFLTSFTHTVRKLKIRIVIVFISFVWITNFYFVLILFIRSTPLNTIFISVNCLRMVGNMFIVRIVVIEIFFYWSAFIGITILHIFLVFFHCLVILSLSFSRRSSHIFWILFNFFIFYNLAATIIKLLTSKYTL